MPAAWSTPRNWTAGELVTAAIGNSAWRDNLMYLKDSPTFDGSVTVTGTTLLTGVATLTAAPVFSSATASQAVFTNGSKALVSNAITGTGNVVMSASPTLTGTIAGAAMTLSSTLVVTGATTLSSTVATGALTVTGAATVSTTLGVTGAITSATSVALTGTTNNLGTITTGVWNAGAVTSSGSVTALSGIFTAPSSANVLDLRGRSVDSISTVLFKSNDGASQYAKFQVASNSFQFDVASGAATNFTVNGSATMSISSGGLLTVSGLGTHSFSASGSGTNKIQLTQATDSATNYAQYVITAGTTEAYWYAFPQSYTTSAMNVAGAGVLSAASAGGWSISATHASGAIRFYSGGTTLRGSFDTSGNLGLVLPLKMQNNSAAMTTALAMSGNLYDVVILGGNTNYSGLYYNATPPAANAGLNGAVQVTHTGSIYFYSGGSRYVLTGVLG